ncbi:hypothetical protein EJB05_38655, partial [Eragrostis curvula]
TREGGEVLSNTVSIKKSVTSSRNEQPKCREAAVGKNEPPEAVLQGLAMAGLVGILRQLGDLAELAADVFQELQDQVMAASARGNWLALLYDADGDGACFRRIPIRPSSGPALPSFSRTPSSEHKHISEERKIDQSFRARQITTSHQSQPSLVSETETSENASPRFLSMLRQLKTSTNQWIRLLKPEAAAAAKHSEAGETQRGNAQQLQESVMPYCSDAGSDYGEQCGELGRTSSFEARLSPDFRTPEHDSIEEESSHDTSNGIISHGITSTMHVQPRHNTAPPTNQVVFVEPQRRLTITRLRLFRITRPRNHLHLRNGITRPRNHLRLCHR